jgi:hypothetical protein
MGPGTQVVFQAIDLNGIKSTSDAVTILVRRGVFSCLPLVVTGVLNCFGWCFAVRNAVILAECRVG